MPTKTALASTANGIERNGLRASVPNAVALSNPTKLKMASTNPKRSDDGVTPCSVNCGRCRRKPNVTNVTVISTRISATEASSNPSIRRVDRRMSLYATSHAPPTTAAVRTTANSAGGLSPKCVTGCSRTFR